MLDFLLAHINIIINAPTAGAALSIPNPCDPTFKMSCAYIGSSAIAPPNKTAIMSREIATKIDLVLNTKDKKMPKNILLGKDKLIKKKNFMTKKMTIYENNSEL